LNEQTNKEQDIDEQQLIACVLVLVVRNFNKYASKNIRVEFPSQLKSMMNWHVPNHEFCC